MKKLFSLLLVVPLVVGCAVKANAPLPQNAVNATDAEINAILQAAHAAVVQYDNDVAAGFVPSAALKTAVSQLTNALNIAQPLEQTFHTTLQSNPGAAEPPALSTAVSQVSAAMTNLTSVSTVQK
jgi:hypothetical protein